MHTGSLPTIVYCCNNLTTIYFLCSTLYPPLTPCIKVISTNLIAEGGYMFEPGEEHDGLVLAAFPRPEGALRWCLSCQSAMVDQDWPEELLRHELGEELRIWGCCVREDIKHQRILHRGEKWMTAIKHGFVIRPFVLESQNRLSACKIYRIAHIGYSCVLNVSHHLISLTFAPQVSDSRRGATAGRLSRLCPQRLLALFTMGGRLFGRLRLQLWQEVDR